MEVHKAARKITEEILNDFRLPRKLCYGPMNAWVWRAISVGIDIGKNMTKRSKPVASLDKNGKIVKTYTSMAAAARDVGLATYTNITRSIKTGQKAAGYRWRLIDPNDHYIYRVL